MTTFRRISKLSKPGDGEQIPAGTLSYFRERNRNHVHNLVLEAFAEGGVSQAEIARRLGKRPDVVCRLIGAPGNWTLDTVSDLLLAIGGLEPEYSYGRPFDAPSQNYREPDWLDAKGSVVSPRPETPVRATTSSVFSKNENVVFQ